ncbi:hypothetical protein LCGC14_1613170 [marine sediment metagenome]|uniref:Uncharacterized protein n=1 Tax=marine sediment metagenome TaxID=412755 RepID=A0A0F9I7Y0_9ZZZZ
MGFGKVVKEDYKDIEIMTRKIRVKLRSFDSGLYRVTSYFMDRKSPQFMLERNKELESEVIRLTKMLENKQITSLKEGEHIVEQSLDDT